MENTDFQLQFLSFSLTLSLEIQISRLVYTNGGDAILVLASNGIHFLWKWPQDLNSSGVATPKVHPNLWKPRSGLELMNNDLPSTNPEEEAMSYFDLSKNDSYLISPTRGMISIFEYLQR
ncbi:topless-related protein 1-like isoform X1 [Prunus yedoensis var. nudiflora]|uniref:Topless-related protein 1-like isoform X1 n=1 Tax=Prunus yedoensis var. nudiflora TaxID=2094558 RepID=A0A314Y9Y8_PRUYE|nr:topless-related protein 1-like isoform X1 [Prunus yedoensis var. nudiflora]